MLTEDVNILVVDDVNSIRVQIRDLLKQFGFKKITLAANGEEAKIMMLETPFHIVLSDWQMQPTDGFELLKYVRGNPNLKEMAFIMVTGESTKERVIEAIKQGVDDYLVKPFTFGQVQNKVYSVLLKRKVL